MNTTTVGVDLAKHHIQVAVADEHYRILQCLRLTRGRFESFAAKQPASVFVMEACGSSQPWGRKLEALGHEVRLLPAQYVRAYVRRNKTDAADAAALIEASRSPDIRPVAIKTVHQQQVMALHRLREHCKRMRTAVGDFNRFPSGRHFASWLGITAREFSSGEQRRLGRISKRGDDWLRAGDSHDVHDPDTTGRQ